MASDDIDMREAINAISDVVQNRPRPLRELDQIYMKTGDMLLQAELVARWAAGKRLAFIGDGDAIGVSAAYLVHRKILPEGPSKIHIFDFDERICNSIERFADSERMGILGATLYNCLDAFPELAKFDCFYTNPPWGASNGGESVNVFVQRGMEATGYLGEGLVVIADGDQYQWCQTVLHATQQFAGESGYYVRKMMPKVHQYHLDDAPELRSCNLFLKPVSMDKKSLAHSIAITDKKRLQNFYGNNNPPQVKFVREKTRVDYGKAHDSEYFFEKLEGGK
jgi:N4-bis(aminopropyl)spermidine synthase